MLPTFVSAATIKTRTTRLFKNALVPLTLPSSCQSLTTGVRILASTIPENQPAATPGWIAVKGDAMKAVPIE